MAMNWLQPQHYPMSNFEEYYLMVDSLFFIWLKSQILYSYLFQFYQPLDSYRKTERCVFLAPPFPLGQILSRHSMPLTQKGLEQTMVSGSCEQFLRTHQLMSKYLYCLHGIEGIRLLLKDSLSLAQVPDIIDKILALGDEFFLRLAFQLLTDGISKVIKKFDLLNMLIILHLNPLLLFFVFLIDAFNQGHEVLLDVVLLLTHLHLQTLELLFDHCSILADEFYLVIELRQFIEDLVLVLLIHLAKVDYFMGAVLSKKGVTFPNMPQSEQMASLQSQQQQVISMRCSIHFSFIFQLLYMEARRCLMSFTKRSQSAKLPRCSAFRQCGHQGLLYSIQVLRQPWQANLLQCGHILGFLTIWKQMQHCRKERS